MRITASGQTDVGRQRDHNEDACLIDPDLGLYIVCDGMGGHAAGEIASQETARLVQASLRRQRAVLSNYVNSPTFEQRTQVLQLVEGAVQEACAHIYAMGQSDPLKKGMGTTIAMLLTLGEAAVIAHAGDSRVYLIRDHQAHQLTEDHSLLWHMLKTGKLTRNAMWQQDAYRMIQRRSADTGLKTKIGNHTFRATGITAYLKNNGTLEAAQQIANHESPRTTKLYDRRDQEISLDEVEKIGI